MSPFRLKTINLVQISSSLGHFHNKFNQTFLDHEEEEEERLF